MCSKRVFPIENEKSEHSLLILHIQNTVGTKFQLKLIILTFQTKFAQKGHFWIENEKSEHRYWILHIWISVGTKFQLKLIILTFYIKFAKKRYFRSKTEKMSITIESYMFELV